MEGPIFGLDTPNWAASISFAATWSLLGLGEPGRRSLAFGFNGGVNGGSCSLFNAGAQQWDCGFEFTLNIVRAGCAIGVGRDATRSGQAHRGAGDFDHYGADAAPGGVRGLPGLNLTNLERVANKSAYLLRDCGGVNPPARGGSECTGCFAHDIGLFELRAAQRYP